jgi:hypothetical protein
MDMRQAPRTGCTRRRFPSRRERLLPSLFAVWWERRKPTLLELGAREAVEHIKRAELKAEGYVAELLKQHNAHKESCHHDRRGPSAGSGPLGRSGARSRCPARSSRRTAARGEGPDRGGRLTSNGRQWRAQKLRAETQRGRGGAVGRGRRDPLLHDDASRMTVIDGLMHQASPHSVSFGAVRNPYNPNDRVRSAGTRKPSSFIVPYSASDVRTCTLSESSGRYYQAAQWSVRACGQGQSLRSCWASIAALGHPWLCGSQSADASRRWRAGIRASRVSLDMSTATRLLMPALHGQLPQ